MSRTAVMLALATLFAACSEKPQTADASARKSDEKAWATQDSQYLASGWKSGDQASWEQQLRNRSQGQNEYARAPATKP